MVLDAALQVLRAALPPEGHRGTYLPISFDRVDFHAPMRGTRLKSHVRLHPAVQADPESIGADVYLCGEGGELLVSVTGLHLKRMPAAATADGVTDWLYEVRWLEQPLPDLSAALSEALPNLRERAGNSGYDQLLERLDAVSGAFARRALTGLGSNLRAGEMPGPASGGRPGSDGAPPSPVWPVWSRWSRRTAGGREPGATRKQNCGICSWSTRSLKPRSNCFPAPDHIAGVLRGRVDPLELLFPGGDTSTAERLYEQSPLARAYNNVVRAAVMAETGKSSAGRPSASWRLAVGPASAAGSLSPSFPPAVPSTCSPTSRRFHGQGLTKYRQYPFVRYQTLDLEGPVHPRV